MADRHPLHATFAQILRGRVPNLLRLYLNPFVTQACHALARHVQTTWNTGGEHQTFLANGFDEALSGAIKLARYAAGRAGRPGAGLVLDPAGRLGPYAALTTAEGARVEFVPGLTVVGQGGAIAGGPFGLVVLVATEGADLEPWADAVRAVIRRDAPLVIACVDRAGLTALRGGPAGLVRDLAPDVTVFDETFVDRAVPFGAFTARKQLYNLWNKPGKATFHSTTYQPNTIASLHFLRCLEKADPAFHASLAEDFRRIETDLAFRGQVFRRLYSPALFRLVRAAGFNTDDVQAAGDFVHVNGRRVFDAVSGVACSIRGHNPPTYAAELAALEDEPDAEAELARRLRDLTGLAGMLPAVSGATAVENALKAALVTQYPRRHVLALKAGFGGKTLLALTGTATPGYKEHLDPLYADVHYADPFAPDAEDRITTILDRQPVAVAQVELIQAVGGVRRVPERVIRFLAEGRRRWGHLLLVDEVQTGMYRTGPFTLSGAMGLSPDLLLLGKGTSDMMFPFALTLLSAEVRDKLERAAPHLAVAIRERYGYPHGYRTVLNVLRQAEALDLPARVAAAGELVERELKARLAGCKKVAAVRVFGLLIGVELTAGRWPKWIRKRLATLCLFSLLRHRAFPVLAGFCQTEPNVLKITPSLTAGAADLRAACAALSDVLNRPVLRLLAAGLGGLLRLAGARRKTHEHADVPAADLVAR